MWNKVNHGGEPTKNSDKKWAIFIGRYQPYHWGHIELIQQKFNQMKKIHLQLNKQ